MTVGSTLTPDTESRYTVSKTYRVGSLIPPAEFNAFIDYTRQIREHTIKSLGVLIAIWNLALEHSTDKHSQLHS